MALSKLKHVMGRVTRTPPSVLGFGVPLVNVGARRGVAAILIFAVATSGCSTLTQSTLAKREDYLPAMVQHGAGKPAEALAVLPEREPHGFLTTLERGWLGVLAGKGDAAAMVEVGRDLEARKTLSLSREAKAYFYKETEDGYFPAEHEAIVFHLVNGLAFLQADNLDAAKVEARRAAFYLQSDFGAEKEFDDPALRLWLATLWTACGEWESARVDWRALVRLGAAWAKPLAEREKAPATLALVFGGAGPDLKWTPSLDQGLRGLSFLPSAAPGVYGLAGATFVGAAPTLPWYARHIERDHVLRDVLSGSRYMAESAAPAAVAGATMAAGTTLGVAVIAAGVAGGVGVIYLGLQALGGASVPGEVYGVVVGLGAAVAYAGMRGGLAIMRKSRTTSGEMLDAGMSPIDSYRYARFLPDQLAVAVGEEPLTTVTLLQDGAPSPAPFFRRQVNGGEVLLYYAAGTHTEQAAAALRARWRDREHRRDWILFPGVASAEQARRDCEALTVADGGRIWRLPAWSEFLDGRASGLTNPHRNPAFGTAITVGGELWSHADNVNTGAGTGACRTIDPVHGSEGSVSSCEQPRARLCVATLKEE